MKNTVRRPFFGVNTKCYIYGEKAISLAVGIDRMAEKYDVDIIYTPCVIDIPAVIQNTSRLIVGSQSMDPIIPGRGMGKILPEALAAAGTRLVYLNHSENPMVYPDIETAIQYAHRLGMLAEVCAGTREDCEAIAKMKPDIICCEEPRCIASGQRSSMQYMKEMFDLIRNINPNILIEQGGSISSEDDVLYAMNAGADGTGATSAIMTAGILLKKQKN